MNVPAGTMGLQAGDAGRPDDGVVDGARRQLEPVALIEGDPSARSGSPNVIEPEATAMTLS